VSAGVPVGKIVHMIRDNHGAHKHPKVGAWLGRRPRFVFHYTRTACSCLSPVEGFVAKLTRRRLKRGVFRSIVDLHAAIKRFRGRPTTTPSTSPGSPIPISLPSGAGTNGWIRSTRESSGVRPQVPQSYQSGADRPGRGHRAVRQQRPLQSPPQTRPVAQPSGRLLRSFGALIIAGVARWGCCSLSRLGDCLSPSVDGVHRTAVGLEPLWTNYTPAQRRCHRDWGALTSARGDGQKRPRT
jgi:hypothetical protein